MKDLKWVAQKWESIAYYRRKFGINPFPIGEMDDWTEKHCWRKGLLKRVETAKRYLLDAEEIVDLLNRMEGEDNWYDSSEKYTEYELKDGQVYQVDYTVRYQFKF